MMIHDFDIARFLIGEEIVEVAATGSALVDAAIGAAGDVDTAAAVLRSRSGRLALISNSRRTAYGYDQRVEVHGSRGTVSAGNPVATTVTRAGESGFATDPLSESFVDRFSDAYRLEIEAFCDLVNGGEVDYPDGDRRSGFPRHRGRRHPILGDRPKRRRRRPDRPVGQIPT